MISEKIFADIRCRSRKIDFFDEKVTNDSEPGRPVHMDQRSIYVFLAMKGLSAQAVHDELVAVLGADAVAYSTHDLSTPIG
jgi:hypothetical protein